MARKILEAYDIVYLFLKEVLNLEEDIAKSEAEKIKSTITDETINNLSTFVVLNIFNIIFNFLIIYLLS